MSIEIDERRRFQKVGEVSFCLLGVRFSSGVRISLTGEDGLPIRGAVKLGSMVKVTFSLDHYSHSKCMQQTCVYVHDS